MRNNNGSTILEYMIVLFIILVIAGICSLFFSLKIQTTDEVVSGVVYNTTHNAFISGNTRFSVRASEDTLVTGENQSSYCLPPNSEYKELVDRAAQDKTIKVIVKKSKTFRVAAPWTCINNVEVLEQK